MPCQARLELPGVPLHITQPGVGRCAIFIDDQDRHHYRRLLRKACHKHDAAAAAFVPSQQRKAPDLEDRFGRRILLGEGAEFGLFLNAVNEGRVYYDPGIKLEGISTSAPKAKKRSQFRVASKDLPALYESSRIVDACEEAGR